MRIIICSPDNHGARLETVINSQLELKYCNDTCKGFYCVSSTTGINEVRVMHSRGKESGAGGKRTKGLVFGNMTRRTFKDLRDPDKTAGVLKQMAAQVCWVTQIGDHWSTGQTSDSAMSHLCLLPKKELNCTAWEERAANCKHISCINY